MQMQKPIGQGAITIPCHVVKYSVLLSVLLLAGCAGKTTQITEQVPAGTIPFVASEAVVEPAAVEDVLPDSSKSRSVAAAPQIPEAAPDPEANALEIVFFDYDSSLLSPKARRILEHHAEWLQENQEVTATIEGHCDERGSDAYNLLLGERRAKVTRDYLLAQGVPPDRLAIVSYGEQRPADSGHHETAWEKNRRVEFR